MMRAAMLAFAVLVAGCVSPPAPTPITITLERTPCFGFCPDYTVTISGDGAVTYHGGRFTRISGEQHATAAPQDVAHLVRMIHDADFFNLQDHYRAQITDLPSYRVTVIEGGRSKTVEDYAGQSVGMPPAVSAIEQEIDRVAGTERWVPGGGQPGAK